MTTVLLVLSASAFSGRISINDGVIINVTLCSADHLALPPAGTAHPQSPDLVDVGEQLVVADKVPVDDHGGHGDSSQASTVPLECHGSGGEWTEKLIKLMLSSGRHIGKFFVNE